MASLHYSLGAPTCVQEREADLAAAEAERAALRAERAARLESLLGGATGGAAAEPPASGEEEAPLAGCLRAPRARLAAATAAAYLRAQEVADRSGANDVAQQAGRAALLVADALRSAAQSASAALHRAAPSAPSGCEELDDDDTSAALVPLSSAQTLALECKQAANEAYRAGRYEAALRGYTRACELHPEVSSYHANRSAALAALQRTDDACCACVSALACDAAHPRAGARLAALAVTSAALEACERAGAEAEPHAPRMARLTARLRRVNACRRDGKRQFDGGAFAQAAAEYSRALAPDDTDDPLFFPVGAALLHSNRAAARAALGNHQGALEDATAALRIAPGFAKAAQRREAAVHALRSAAQHAATSSRDALVVELRAAGVQVPDSFPEARLPWGRAPCSSCADFGRDALACRASFGHRAPDADADAWRVGGRVRFRRAAAASAPGASLGTGLLKGSESGGTDTFEVGVITAFDWPSGVHTVQRDARAGTLHVRLRAVEGLTYEPPLAPGIQ